MRRASGRAFKLQENDKTVKVRLSLPKKHSFANLPRFGVWLRHFFSQELEIPNVVRTSHLKKS